MAAEAAKIGAVAVAAAAPGAVASVGGAAEAAGAAEVVEVVDAEQAFGRLSACTPSCRRWKRRRAAWRAPARCRGGRPGEAAAYRAAELVRATRRWWPRQSLRVRPKRPGLIEAAGEMLPRRRRTWATCASALMAAGTQRGFEGGACARTPSMPWPERWRRVPSTRAKRPVRPCCRTDSLAALSAEVQAYQPTTPEGAVTIAGSWRAAKSQRGSSCNHGHLLAH
ncbi:MAG: hypothetical protein ACLTDR_02585 [Adlercreutzia equolifaciens]